MQRAAPVLRLQVDASQSQRLVIDPSIDIEFGPALAPFFQKVGAVPVAILFAEPVLAGGEDRFQRARPLLVGSPVEDR
jgi:hypothetical protein